MGLRRYGWAASLAFLLVLAAVCLWIILDGFRWLSTGETPRKADLMIVLAGGAAERDATALDLWREGYAPRILVTDGLGYPDLVMRRLRKGGVPVRALLAPLRPAHSTYEDALAIRQLLQRNNFESILVVTSPYHCRRAQLILGRVLRGMGVRVTVTPSVSMYMQPEVWWKSHQGWITVAPEFPKLLLDWLMVPVGVEVGAGG